MDERVIDGERAGGETGNHFSHPPLEIHEAANAAIKKQIHSHASCEVAVGSKTATSALMCSSVHIFVFQFFKTSFSGFDYFCFVNLLLESWVFSRFVALFRY